MHYHSFFVNVINQKQQKYPTYSNRSSKHLFSYSLCIYLRASLINPQPIKLVHNDDNIRFRVYWTVFYGFAVSKVD